MAKPTDPPSPPTYISLGDCEELEDLDRLDPHEYADLAGRPATILDVHRLRLEVGEVVRALDKSISRLAERDEEIAHAVRNRGRDGA